MCELGDDSEVLITHQFTIDLAGDDVRISDGNGKRGGNARGRGNTLKIRWTNGTLKPCTLVFHEWIVDGNGNPDEVPIWPFEDPADPDDATGNQLHIPTRGTGNNPWFKTVTLKSFRERTVIKYDVVVNPSAPVGTLDPMIVVER